MATSTPLLERRRKISTSIIPLCRIPFSNRPYIRRVKSGSSSHDPGFAV